VHAECCAVIVLHAVRVLPRQGRGTAALKAGCGRHGHGQLAHAPQLCCQLREAHSTRRLWVERGEDFVDHLRRHGRHHFAAVDALA
jgi:hypothetical protein